jgi:DNA segregation ATPase FtsK/SpoIIIE, S-DNA-T family
MKIALLMSHESTETRHRRSVRWDLVGIVMFGMAILVGLSLLTYDPADDITKILGKPDAETLGVWYSPKAFPVNEKIQNACGAVGALVSQALLQATGIGAYLVAALLALGGVVCFRQQPWASPLGRSIGWTLVLVAVCAMPSRFGLHPNISVPIGGGGYLGALANLWIDRNLAHAGGVIAVLSTFVCGLLLSTEYALLRYFGYAATGGMVIVRYFRIPSWNWSRHRELTSGTFSPSRSDLPASLTLRQNPVTISTANELDPIPLFTALNRKPFAAGNATAVPVDGAAGAVVESETGGDEGPAIRIGRRNTPSVIATDLGGQAKPINRTDLVTPKPKPLSASAATPEASLESWEDRDSDADEFLDDDSAAEEQEDFEVSEEEDYADDLSDGSQEEEDEEYEEADDEVDAPSPDVASSGARTGGRSTLIRNDEPSREPEPGPKVSNRKPKGAVKGDEEKESKKEELYQELNDTRLPEGSEEYILPGLDLLTEGDDFSYDEQTEEVKRKARVLEQTFANFGFNIRVVEIETGPVIAQYEIELEAGLRLSKITGLADDLAIALRVPSVRIVAPIPGKNTVGIEVPNEHRQVVRMREVIEEGASQVRKMKIPLFLGKDVSGKPLSVDLASLPHLLIAGRTGTGKSVCLNSIICSILMARRPDEVRMLMIDPKMVELSGYGRLPHLMHPVVTDMQKAEAILAWAVDKMEERYSLLARAGVRHITSYNQLGREELRERLRPENDEEAEMIPDHLPFIVIVADEMADLMMTAGKEVEAHIIRLAQKSRAVGIHLILATQKPTVDVITGLIKSNLPARISFQVASRTDSRVVLDENGADKLLGNGDMLFLWPGTSTILRGQGTYLSDDEINAIVDHCSTGEQNFVQELVQLKVNRDEDSAIKPGSFKKRDDLYEAAVDIVVREGRGSCSLLQRALGIGYGRAARLIDFMAEDGIVGEYNGSQAREVVITLAEWEIMRAPPETPETGGKSRSNKIRRQDGWSESPKPSKRRKKSDPEVHEDMEVDAVGGGPSRFDGEGSSWDDD